MNRYKIHWTEAVEDRYDEMLERQQEAKRQAIQRKFESFFKNQEDQNVNKYK